MRAEGLPPIDPRTTPTAASAADSSRGTSRSQILRYLGRAALGAGVVTVGGTLGSPAAVLADNALAATKKSYFRYVPRIQVSTANAGSEHMNICLVKNVEQTKEVPNVSGRP